MKTSRMLFQYLSAVTELSTVSIFSSVRTLGRALTLNTATFSKCVNCVTIEKIRFNHEYLLFKSENHFHR
jgi:hypothetical protein